MSISSIATTVSNNTKNIFKKELTAKVMGGVTLASVIYDTHMNGKEKATALDQIDTAIRYNSNYNQFMTMHKPSQTIADLKNGWFDLQQNFSWHHIISKLKGYMTGMAQVIFSNIPEIALSILALNVRNHKFIGKLSGVLLTLNAIKTVLYDVIGIGSKDD